MHTHTHTQITWNTHTPWHNSIFCLSTSESQKEEEISLSDWPCTAAATAAEAAPAKSAADSRSVCCPRFSHLTGQWDGNLSPVFFALACCAEFEFPCTTGFLSSAANFLPADCCVAQPAAACLLLDLAACWTLFSWLPAPRWLCVVCLWLCWQGELTFSRQASSFMQESPARTSATSCSHCWHPRLKTLVAGAAFASCSCHSCACMSTSRQDSTSVRQHRYVCMYTCVCVCTCCGWVEGVLRGQLWYLVKITYHASVCTLESIQSSARFCGVILRVLLHSSIQFQRKLCESRCNLFERKAFRRRKGRDSAQERCALVRETETEREKINVLPVTILACLEIIWLNSFFRLNRAMERSASSLFLSRRRALPWTMTQSGLLCRHGVCLGFPMHVGILRARHSEGMTTFDPRAKKWHWQWQHTQLPCAAVPAVTTPDSTVSYNLMIALPTHTGSGLCVCHCAWLSSLFPSGKLRSFSWTGEVTANPWVKKTSYTNRGSSIQSCALYERNKCPWDTHYQFSIKTLLSKKERKKRKLRNLSSPGGFPIYYVPESRTRIKRTPLEEIGCFERGPLPPGSWLVNIVNRKPPRRFLSIKVRVGASTHIKM